MKLVYKCYSDGETCENEIPKVDSCGNIIPPKEYKNPEINCSGDWQICMSCNRNHTISGTCFGKLKIE